MNSLILFPNFYKSNLPHRLIKHMKISQNVLKTDTGEVYACATIKTR